MTINQQKLNLKLKYDILTDSMTNKLEAKRS